VRLATAGEGDIRSARDALADWLSGGNHTAGRVLSDGCVGYACGTGCRANRGHPRNPSKLVTVAASAVPRKSHKAQLRWLFRCALAAGVLVFLAAAYQQFNSMASDLAPMPPPPRGGRSGRSQPAAPGDGPPAAKGRAPPGRTSASGTDSPPSEGTPLLVKQPATVGPASWARSTVGAASASAAAVRAPPAKAPAAVRSARPSSQL
jgi:hypothetical protein